MPLLGGITGRLAARLVNLIPSPKGLALDSRFPPRAALFLYFSFSACLASYLDLVCLRLFGSVVLGGARLAGLSSTELPTSAACFGFVSLSPPPSAHRFHLHATYLLLLLLLLAASDSNPSLVLASSRY